MWNTVAKSLLRTKVHPDYLCTLLLVQKGRSILTRLLSSRNCWQHTAGAVQPFNMSVRIQKVEVLDVNHFVRVHWEDGSKSLYPAVWLRDNCQCPDCFLHSAKARKLLLEDLDVNIGVKEVTLTDRKKLYITWPDKHTSEFEAEWLKKRCFSEQARAEMQEELFLPVPHAAQDKFSPMGLILQTASWCEYKICAYRAHRKLRALVCKGLLDL